MTKIDLVFLHGPAASGKLTTARALEDLVGFPVFYNHLTVDLLTTVFPFGSEPFVRLREQFWLSVIREAAHANRSLSFTFTPELTVQPAFPRRVRQVVEAADGQVRFVALQVSIGEQKRRIDAPSRREFHKLTDLATLRRLADHRASIEPLPADLTVDTDLSSAEQTAAAIVACFGLTAAVRDSRYPDVLDLAP